MPTTTKPYPKTPELDKMKAIKDQSQVIGAFLDSIGQEGICLAEYSKRDELVPVGKSIEKILADYFEIDLDKCEAERRAILEHIRS